MTLSKRERFLLFALIIVIISALYYSMFFESFSKSLSSINKEIRTLKERVSSYSTKAAYIDQLRENVNILDQEVNSYVKDKVNTNYNQAVIIVYLQKVFGDNSAQQMSIELSEPIDEDYYNIVNLAVEFKASYENTKKVINELENGQYKQYIDSIKITGNSDDNSVLEVRILFSHIYENTGDGNTNYPFMDGGKFSKPNPFK